MVDMQSLNKISLINDIIKVFSKLEIPKNYICIQTYDDEGTEKIFLNTNWKDHNILNLRLYVSSLSFFTPEAFRYYLPAFMLAELNTPIEADIILDSICFIINDYPEKLNLFTNEELKIVILFLQYVKNKYGEDDCEYVPKYTVLIKTVESKLN